LTGNKIHNPFTFYLQRANKGTIMRNTASVIGERAFLSFCPTLHGRIEFCRIEILLFYFHTFHTTSILFSMEV
jgi:hypothetical protein